MERTAVRAHRGTKAFRFFGSFGFGKEGTDMHSLRVATGMTGLLLVTSILLAAQFLSGSPALLSP
jgi:hypothetical protein